MKKLAILPVVALTVALIAAPVYAADSDSSTSSPNGNGNVASVSVDGKDITDDCVLTYASDADKPGVNAEVAANLKEAEADIVAAGSIANLPDGKGGTISGDLQKALDFYGSTTKAADLDTSFLVDLSYLPNGVYTDVNGEVTIVMEDFAFDSEFVIVVHDKNGNYEVIDPATYTFTDNGLIKFTSPNGMSPFLFVYGDRSSIPTATPTPTAAATATPTAAAKAETKSPQTGESAGIYLLLISAGLAVAGVVCVKRSMKASEK